MTTTEFIEKEKALLDKFRIVTLLRDGKTVEFLKGKYSGLSDWVQQAYQMEYRAALKVLEDEMSALEKQRPADLPEYDDEP